MVQMATPTRLGQLEVSFQLWSDLGLNIGQGLIKQSQNFHQAGNICVILAF